MSDTRSIGESQDRPEGETPAGSYGGVPAAQTPATTTGTGTSDGPAPAGEAGQGGREWVGQLQEMIDNLATQAAPVLRDIGAKAAELAAAAGDKAGPLAHRAAEATEAAGARLAERGRGMAADLRRDEAEGQGAAAGDTPNAVEPGADADSTGAGSSVKPIGSKSYPSDTSGTVGE